MRHSLTGLTGILLFALGGCGGSDTAETTANGSESAGNQAEAPAAGSVDPCSLVTAAEVGQVIGEEVLSARADGASCVYETADAQASSVTVEVKSGDAAAEMDIMRRTAGALRDIGKAAAKEGAAGQDVDAMLKGSGDQPKLGDDALFSANQLLSVRKGDTYISVQPPIMRSRMSGGSPLLSQDDKKKMAIAIAEKMVAKLP